MKVVRRGAAPLVTFAALMGVWLTITYGVLSEDRRFLMPPPQDVLRMGFMDWAGERLASQLGGLSWPLTYVLLVVLYVAVHYLFVSQTSQVLALLGVFLDVGIQGGVPAPLMAFALLFASSYFSVITPQGGSQNVIFVGSGYLTQPELYRLGLLTTVFCLLMFLVLGTPWLLFVAG